MITVLNRRSRTENIRKKHPEAEIFDVTSKSESDEMRLLSPFYPHGNIPVPFLPNVTSASVEGIWQGLKVFENAGISFESFGNTTMKNIKRTVRKFGAPLGHRAGIGEDSRLLDYIEARREIYLPSYKWVLDNVPAVRPALDKIREAAGRGEVVLLDYNTNTNVDDPSKPLSHAGLIRMYIEGRYPV